MSGSAAFFLVGSPRSGTTLLRRMLDAHPALAVTPETHFGERYVRKRFEFGPEGAASTRAALLDAFCGSQAFERLGIDEAAFRERAVSRPEDPWWPLEVALEVFGRERGASRVGEKTPSHALHLEALAEAFPDAGFVLLWRDPRAVVASFGRVSWSQREPSEAAEIWRRYSSAMRRFRAVRPDRCIELRYEELVTHPEAVLRRLCAFLAVDFEPGMLAFHEREPDVAPTRERVDTSLTFQPPQSSRAEAWREELSPTGVRRIEAVCGGEMVRAGYAPESGRAGRLAAAVAVLPPIWRKRLRRRLSGRRV